MINLLKKIFCYYRKKNVEKFIHKYTDIGINSIINYSATVQLLCGSKSSDIKIGNNFKLSGGLISSNGGKITIGNNCLVGPGCYVGAVNSVIIHDNVMISINVIVIDNNNHSINPYDRKIMTTLDYSSEFRGWKYSISKPIEIMDNVWIGRNSIINKGVTIGENSIVAAGSIVTKDVPSNCIVAGNPARVVKTNINKSERLILNNG